MKFYKLISVLLHPIVIPTIGVILYFLLLPNRLYQEQKLALLGLVFIATYLIPLLLLILLKSLGQITSYQVHTIKERKLPVAFMIVLFYAIGRMLFEVTQIRDLGVLFYATALGLTIVYLLFIFKLKTSLHLLSMGVALGFFLYLTYEYGITFTPVILLIILLSGLLASARLHLKAHTSKEVYIGFFLGVVSPFLTSYFL